MRFAEVFLRLGAGLVAWMMLYAYLLWLAALHAMGCGPDGDEMHRLLLGLAPFACGSAYLLRVTEPFVEVHRILRWLGVPLLLLLPFALRNIWYVLQAVNIGRTSICAIGPPPTWQLMWGPIQIFTLLVVLYLGRLIIICPGDRTEGDNNDNGV